MHEEEGRTWRPEERGFEASTSRIWDPSRRSFLKRGVAAAAAAGGAVTALPSVAMARSPAVLTPGGPGCFSFSPVMGGEDAIIMLSAAPPAPCTFGPIGAPEDSCVVIGQPGGLFIPMQAVLAPTTDTLRVELGPVIPGAVPGPIMQMKGSGAFYNVAAPSGNVTPTLPDSGWVWSKTNPTPLDECASVSDFTPLSAGPDPGVSTRFFSGPPVVCSGLPCTSGRKVLRLTISGDCVAGTEYFVRARAHSNAAGPNPRIGRDCFIRGRMINTTIDALECAVTLCNDVTNHYAAAGLAMQCFAEDLGGNVARLTLEFPGREIDHGNFDVLFRTP